MVKIWIYYNCSPSASTKVERCYKIAYEEMALTSTGHGDLRQPYEVHTWGPGQKESQKV